MQAVAVVAAVTAAAQAAVTADVDEKSSLPREQCVSAKGEKHPAEINEYELLGLDGSFNVIAI